MMMSGKDFLFLIYSPDGSNVYGTRGEECEVIRSV